MATFSVYFRTNECRGSLRTQRRRDNEHRLSLDVDVWVASASAGSAPHLVPLSFDWVGEALLLATPTDSPTGRNLATSRSVRLGLGHTRDVSMIEGEVEVLEIDALPRQRGDRFDERTGFDPRALDTPYRWFRIVPRRIQAWREVNELPDRELMRDGPWLVEPNVWSYEEHGHDDGNANARSACC